MESEIISELAGLGGQEKLDLAEFRDLHTYVECPSDYFHGLGNSNYLSQAHYYELDEPEDEDIKEKFYHLHHLIIQEVIDFCKRNNLNPDYVTLMTDGFQDSIKVGKWIAGTDSCLAIMDEERKIILESL